MSALGFSPSRSRFDRAQLACDLLEAAITVRRAESATNATRRRLAVAMRKVWNKQRVSFLRRLSAKRGKFPVREAISPDDWEPLWSATEDESVAEMRKAIDKAAADALALGAKAAATSLAGPLVIPSFTLKNPRAVAYLDDYGAARVTAINDTTRDRLRALLTRSADEGWSYTRTAKEIRARFDGFTGASPLHHIRDRAELVAVTEVGDAFEEGNHIVALDLEATGERMQKHWYDVGDSRVHEGCRRNTAAGWIDLDADFPSGKQRPLDHPG